MFIIFFFKNLSLGANSQPVPQAQIFYISYMFQIWPRPWCLITKYLFPPFQAIISIFAPQCSLSSSPKILQSMRTHSLFLKHKFVVLVTCFKFDLVLNVSLPNIYSPSFKQLSPIFSPQCSLSSSPKIFHSMRIHSLFLKHKFLVIVICLKFDLALQVSLPPTL